MIKYFLMFMLSIFIVTQASAVVYGGAHVNRNYQRALSLGCEYLRKNPSEDSVVVATGFVSHRIYRQVCVKYGYL